jgi:precorrin-3B methylase
MVTVGVRKIRIVDFEGICMVKRHTERRAENLSKMVDLKLAVLAGTGYIGVVETADATEKRRTEVVGAGEVRMEDNIHMRTDLLLGRVLRSDGRLLRGVLLQDLCCKIRRIVRVRYTLSR